MKISRSVSYHSFEDKVYVHNAANQKDYVMDEVAGEVLNYIAANPGVSAPKLLKFFAVQYVQHDVGEFVDEMLGEEILTEIE